MSARLAIDIGGTFTDGVLIDGDGRVTIDKVLSTPSDLSEAFAFLADELATRVGIDPSSYEEVMHGSTIATNALLEGKGASVGLLVTRGFRDILEIGRQVRSELYNIFTQKPPVLVPRRLVYEVGERINAQGTVTESIAKEDVVTAAEWFKLNDVTSVAICFLHSYLNPEHEQRAAALLHEFLPDVELSVSSSIAPEIKEYWRASTATVNAYVGPVVRQYIRGIVDTLASRGFTGHLGIMHSGGGLASADSIQERPFRLIESGPAAGVAAAAFLARRLGFLDALSFDMGGTTAKAGVILEGRSRVLTEFEVASVAGSGAAALKAAGYPILGEVIDLVEVGAGGGSIAWIDEGNHLRVGPEGAGADPGPASYGRGGKLPTITDANLVLGYLSADHGLGGRITLDEEAARRAIEMKCARPLGLTVEQAALGIRSIANATMVQALRLVSIERGHDPRRFALIAFGGAGPLHACDLAAELGVRTIVIPPNPGVASAWGLLLSDIKHDVRSTHLMPLSSTNVPSLLDSFADLEKRLMDQLRNEHLDEGRFRRHLYVEARYLGQASRLRVDLPDHAGVDNEKLAEDLAESFHAKHQREFGFRVSDEPIQFATVGITAIAPRPTAGLALSPGPVPVADGRGDAQQDVMFDASRGYETVASYQRADLGSGAVIDGPAVIHEFDSTTALAPGFVARVTDMGVVQIERTDEG